jgi:general secretion pathway protein G
VNHRGFTLLELVVVIAVIGILAAAVAPAVVQRVLDQRIESTRTEAQTLYEAAVGAPSENRLGFMGDIGRLPASLQELVAPGSLPSYNTSATRGIGMGWRGPYVNSGTSANDYLTDSFGRNYTGIATGQIRSAGPDGIANNSDDIVYPPSVPVLLGDVTVAVKTITSGKTVVDPAGYRVDLFYASNGAEAFLSDTSSPFSFSNVPSGLHAIRVVKTGSPNAGSIVSQDTVVVRPGSAVAADLWF